MKNYLNPIMDDQGLHKISTLGLAHIGDSVFEILVRTKLATDGILTSKNLHRETVNIVNANAQAKFAKTIIDILSDEEKKIFIRGRNSSPKTVPKTSTREQYGLATALESLFGYLYLKQQYDRINELFDMLVINLEKEKENS